MRFKFKFILKKEGEEEEILLTSLDCRCWRQLRWYRYQWNALYSNHL